MAFSQQDIINAYKQTVGAGGMSEADFVNQAMNQYGVSADQLRSAQGALTAPAQVSAPAQTPDYLGRVFSPESVSGAQQWASGKDMNTILGKASELGLTPDQVGQVLGVSGQQVLQHTGYGQGAAGFNPDGGLNYQYGWNKDPLKASNGQKFTNGYMPGGATSLQDWSWSKDGGFQFKNSGQTKPQQGVLGTGTRSEGQQPFNYDQANPYMAQMANTISQQIGQNLGRNILPTVRSGAQAVGGFGGSRQGVVEANVLNDASREMANAITSMYYGDYNNAMNRQLQKYQTDSNFDLGLGQLALGNKSADNQYSLGLGQLALGNKTADNNFNLGQGQLSNQMTLGKMNDATNRYQSDNSLEAARLGANASMSNAATSANAAMNAANNNYNLGMRQADLSELGLSNQMFSSMMQGLAGLGTGLYGTGTTQQNAPWNTLAQFTGSMSGFTPFGQTQTSGGTAGQMMGGALAGAQLGNMFSGNSDPYKLVNSGGVQNLPQMYLNPSNTILNGFN